MTRRSLVASLGFGLSALSAATPQNTPATRRRRRPLAQEIWVRTELYFGTNRPGGEVSDLEFAGFMDCEITPRFPDGLTLLTGYGQYLTALGALTRERSKVLILFYPEQTADVGKRIEEIRDAYKRAFQQESVLRVDGYVVVSF
jgi:hypothetical protein